jgi:hypothetical protein
MAILAKKMELKFKFQNAQVVKAKSNLLYAVERT